MKKIRIKDEKDVRRELLRASRMQLKAELLLGQGDRKNGMEIYRASLDHTAEAMEYILAHFQPDQEIRRLLLSVTISGVIIEETFDLRKGAKM